MANFYPLVGGRCKTVPPAKQGHGLYNEMHVVARGKGGRSRELRSVM